MGQSNGLRGGPLIARFCYGASFAAGFAAVAAIMLWIAMCYLGLGIVHLSNSQRRAVVNYAHLITQKSTVLNQTTPIPDYLETSINSIPKTPTVSTHMPARGASNRGQPNPPPFDGRKLTDIDSRTAGDKTAAPSVPQEASGIQVRRVSISVSSENIPVDTDKVSQSAGDTASDRKEKPDRKNEPDAVKEDSVQISRVPDPGTKDSKDERESRLNPTTSHDEDRRRDSDDDEKSSSRRLRDDRYDDRPRTLDTERSRDRQYRDRDIDDKYRDRDTRDRYRDRDTSDGYRDRDTRDRYRDRDTSDRYRDRDTNDRYKDGDRYTESDRRPSNDSTTRDEDKDYRDKDRQTDDRYRNRYQLRTDRISDEEYERIYQERNRYSDRSSIVRNRDDGRVRDEETRKREIDPGDSDDKNRDRDLGRPRERDIDRSKDRDEGTSRDRDEVRSRDRDEVRSRDRDEGRSRDKDEVRSRDRDESRSRDRDEVRSRDRDEGRSRDRDEVKSRDREGSRSRDRDEDKPRDRDEDRSRDRYEDRRRGDDRFISRTEDRTKDRDYDRDRTTSERGNVDDEIGRYPLISSSRTDETRSFRERDSTKVLPSEDYTGSRSQSSSRNDWYYDKPDRYKGKNKDESDYADDEYLSTRDRIYPTRTIDKEGLGDGDRYDRRSTGRIYLTQTIDEGGLGGGDRYDRRSTGRIYPTRTIDEEGLGDGDRYDRRSTGRISPTSTDYSRREESRTKLSNGRREVVLDRRSYIDDEEDAYKARQGTKIDASPLDEEDRKRRMNTKDESTRTRSSTFERTYEDSRKDDYEDEKYRRRGGSRSTYDDESYERDSSDSRKIYADDDTRSRSKDDEVPRERDYRKYDSKSASDTAIHQYSTDEDRDARREHSSISSDRYPPDEETLSRREYSTSDKDKYSPEEDRSARREYTDSGTRRTSTSERSRPYRGYRESEPKSSSEKRYSDEDSRSARREPLPDLVEREKRYEVKDSTVELVGGTSLSAKDVIEAAYRQPDVPDKSNRRNTHYPVFDPRTSNLTSPDYIRPSERKGTTIMSKKRKRRNVARFYRSI